MPTLADTAKGLLRSTAAPAPLAVGRPAITPVNINVPAYVNSNSIIQIPCLGNGQGVTIINQGEVPISLCNDDKFEPSATISLPGGGASIPWTTGTTVFVQSPVSQQLLILPEPFNYYNPNTITTVDTPEQIDQFNVPAGMTTNQTVTIPSGTRTLVIEIVGYSFPEVFSIAVSGLNSLYTYFGPGPPYLGGGEIVLKNVPINPAVDSEYLIEIITGTGGGQCTVYADQLSYDDSEYYNGLAQSISVTTAAAGNTTIIQGPIRVLSCAVWGNNANGNAAIAISPGNRFLGHWNGSDSTTFPDKGVILSAAESLVFINIVAVSSTGSAVYAYP